MTTAGSPRDGAADADRIRAAVLGCDDVADLSAGPFGEVASYLPGRTVSGVRVDDEHVEVHIVAQYGRSLRAVADDIGTAVEPLLEGRPLSVVVEDILLPGERIMGEDSAHSDVPATGAEVPDTAQTDAPPTG